MGLGRGFNTIINIIKYKIAPNETTIQEEINIIKSALTNYKGSPLYYPKAQENFNLIPTFSLQMILYLTNG